MLTIALAFVVVAQTEAAQSPNVDASATAEPVAAEGPALTSPTLDPAMEAAITELVNKRLEERLAEKKTAGFFDDTPLPVSLAWRGDFFTKLMVRNNQSGGCVSYGNPSPEGDNFSGDNGICSELGLTVTGRVSERVEVGARLQTRFGAQWADWFENGDERDRAETKPRRLSATSWSLFACGAAHPDHQCHSLWCQRSLDVQCLDHRQVPLH